MMSMISETHVSRFVSSVGEVAKQGRSPPASSCLQSNGNQKLIKKSIANQLKWPTQNNKTVWENFDGSRSAMSAVAACGLGVVGWASRRR